MGTKIIVVVGLIVVVSCNVSACSKWQVEEVVYR
jgi:hypothetical protein